MLRIEKTTYKIAKQACLDWHYSKTCPVGIYFAVYEHDIFIGVIVFTNGNRGCEKPFALQLTDIATLSRVALTNHESFTSHIVTSAIKELREYKPNVKMILSYADMGQDHKGKIYQAMNFIYLGKSKQDNNYFKLQDGTMIHQRYLYDKLKINPDLSLGAVRVKGQGKHKYILPLTKKLKRQLKHMAQPYP